MFIKNQEDLDQYFGLHAGIVLLFVATVLLSLAFIDSFPDPKLVVLGVISVIGLALVCIMHTTRLRYTLFYDNTDYALIFNEGNAKIVPREWIEER